MHFENLEQMWAVVESTMDIKRDGWIANSDVLRDYLIQRRIEDYLVD